MDAYSKMRQEIATALNNTSLTINDVLNAVDSVAINYDVIKRERDCQDYTNILKEYINCCEYEKMSTGTIENYQLISIKTNQIKFIWKNKNIKCMFIQIK